MLLSMTPSNKSAERSKESNRIYRIDQKYFMGKLQKAGRGVTTSRLKKKKIPLCSSVLTNVLDNNGFYRVGYMQHHVFYTTKKVLSARDRGLQSKAQISGTGTILNENKFKLLGFFGFVFR